MEYTCLIKKNDAKIPKNDITIHSKVAKVKIQTTKKAIQRTKIGKIGLKNQHPAYTFTYHIGQSSPLRGTFVTFLRPL